MKWKLLLLVGVLAMVIAPARADRHELGERSYLLHVPPGLKGPAPLLLALHGGGGNAAQFERWTKFSQLADREGFLVAYPEGLGHNWNDGRQDVQARAFREKVDDVAFLRAVVEDIPNVDRTRVYATGASNGGFMASRLGIEAPDVFAAIAPVIGGIPLGFKPSKPMPVLVIQGTEDPLVPYGGGEVNAFGSARGRLIPTEEAIQLWRSVNECQEGQVTSIDTVDDGCRVEVSDWGPVQFYKVIGGGHTWASAGQYMPVKWIGRECRDFDATETVWAFVRQFSGGGSAGSRAGDPAPRRK